MQYSQTPSLKRPLAEQIAAITAALRQNQLVNIDAVLLVGSCARGKATFRSDIDLLIVLDSDSFNATQVHRIHESFEEILKNHSQPLPLQFIVVGRGVFDSTDRAMQDNLKDSHVIYDRLGNLVTKLGRLKGDLR